MARRDLTHAWHGCFASNNSSNRTALIVNSKGELYQKKPVSYKIDILKRRTTNKTELFFDFFFFLSHQLKISTIQSSEVCEESGLRITDEIGKAVSKNISEVEIIIIVLNGNLTFTNRAWCLNKIASGQL